MPYYLNPGTKIGQWCPWQDCMILPTSWTLISSTNVKEKAGWSWHSIYWPFSTIFTGKYEFFPLQHFKNGFFFAQSDYFHTTRSHIFFLESRFLCIPLSLFQHDLLTHLFVMIIIFCSSSSSSIRFFERNVFNLWWHYYYSHLSLSLGKRILSWTK